MYIVYAHYCVSTGKYYVGQTSKTIDYRWRAHIKSSQCGSRTRFHAAIRKHGRDDFKHITLEIFETLEEAKFAEVKWVAALNTFNPDHGYNMTHGGDSSSITPERNRKISESKRGKKRTDEEKRAIAEGVRIALANLSEDAKKRRAHRGRKLSQETCAKMSASRTGKSSGMKGKKQTEETKRRISEGVKRYYNDESDI